MTSKLRFFECITGSLLLIVLMAINPQISTRAQMGGGGMGGGMGQNPGNMGNGMGALMLVSGGTPYRHDGATIKMEDAITIATGLLNAIGDSSLALDEVEEWEFNYYIVVKQAPPSKYKAFQLIMDKWTGAVMPEPGPGMIWNQKYGGMMGSMSDGMPGHMNRRERKITEPTFTVTLEAAAGSANQFLRERFSRALVVESTPDLFFGFYNFDVNDAITGAKYGMLSVNGSSGQVWYHTWHGNFVQSKELN